MGKQKTQKSTAYKSNRTYKRKTPISSIKIKSVSNKMDIVNPWDDIISLEKMDIVYPLQTRKTQKTQKTNKTQKRLSKIKTLKSQSQPLDHV